MKLVAYDKDSGKWVEGDLVTAQLKVANEYRHFYGDNIKMKKKKKKKKKY